MIARDDILIQLPNATKFIAASSLYHVLLCLVLIMVTSRLLHQVLKYTFQPLVISEMIAGILIGPSLLGYLSPDLYSYIIPANIIPLINIIAQIGIIIYMFLIGIEFDFTIFKNSNMRIMAIAKSSIAFPFILGVGLAIWLYNNNLMLPDHMVSFSSFALFIGISMSITAFPVLARILDDQKMQKTKLGMLVLTCAAVNDVIAWCLLAFVIGLVNSVISSAFVTIIATIFYIIIMLIVIKPLIQKFSDYLIQHKYKEEQQISLVLIALLSSALIAEYIGIHAIFGAFLLGIIMPDNNLVVNTMAHKLKAVICSVFLPAFFAYIGIKTQINLISSLDSLIICGVIITIAIIGKFGGTYMTARLFGMNNRLATSLGILMNTRGLVELIVLNIGLELGIISQQLFTILVIMALFTTCMTGPMLHYIKKKHRNELMD